MNKSHIENIFNSMINDVAYIKLSTYETNKKIIKNLSLGKKNS